MVTSVPTSPRRWAVFVDRDGVLNPARLRHGQPYPPDSVADFRLLPDVEVAVESLRAAGALVIVVTNQPDIATGKQTASTVAAMHERLRQWLKVDDIRMCPHIDADNCACRKPKPGMLLDAAAAYGIDLAASFMVGDRWRDIDAGTVAGCETFFIDYGYDERGPATPPTTSYATWRRRRGSF